ncbi:MAG: hypothetical protein HFI63_11870 [Lachnospiraceae bacterium]|nr:hypothetical protein [Lachnospiraceae bacterium]
MKYVIYGANRVAKDFMYIFDELNILYLIDERCTSETWCGYPLVKLEEALHDHQYDQIIICDFDKKQKEQSLQKNGLIYKKDYIYEEDFFDGLDEISIPTERKFLVWGTGQVCQSMMKREFPWPVEFFIDSYKKYESFLERPVVLPQKVSDWKQYYVIIAVERDSEIRKFLLAQGMIENIDFINWKVVLSLPSLLLRRTIFDRSSYDLDCNTMLNHLEILPEGDTRYCCTTFVQEGSDNILKKDQEGLWKSNIHKIMCLSTENKTFSFCDKSMCPLFLSKNKKVALYKEEPYKKMTHFPEVLALGYDPSCNLSCSTCRKKLHVAKGEELEHVERITKEIQKNYLSVCNFLILAGNGEVFFSPAYRKIYESETCDPKYIRLLSNGLLFTPQNWERFRKGKNGKIMLTVSVDAATKRTYEHIRRNGNFDILQKNMEFAAELHRDGELHYFRMNFVVQKENYKEMVPFVEWGNRLGVDEVFFTKILNWGTYTDEEFAQISMMESDGITPKVELKEILVHPIMKSEIVDLGTIQYSHKIDTVGIVENYYMWELEKRGGKLFT